MNQQTPAFWSISVPELLQQLTFVQIKVLGLLVWTAFGASARAGGLAEAFPKAGKRTFWLALSRSGGLDPAPGNLDSIWLRGGNLFSCCAEASLKTKDLACPRGEFPG